MNGLVTACLLLVTALSCKKNADPPVAPPSPPASDAAPRLVVPHVHGPMAMDGETDEPDWLTPARTGPFVERGGKGLARPYSDARLLWDEQALYLVLYAADESIRAPVKVHDVPLTEQDAFHVVLAVPPGAGRTWVVDVAASGAVSDGVDDGHGGVDLGWESGIKVAMDLDGSLNADDGEEDEEWVVEAALPWKSLGVEPKAGSVVGISISRCDTPKTGGRRCGAWGEGPGGPGQAVIVLQR